MGLAQMVNMTDVCLLSMLMYQELGLWNNILEDRFTNHMMPIYFLASLDIRGNQKCETVSPLIITFDAELPQQLEV